jgi:hypothetical protein
VRIRSKRVENDGLFAVTYIDAFLRRFQVKGCGCHRFCCLQVRPTTISFAGRELFGHIHMVSSAILMTDQIVSVSQMESENWLAERFEEKRHHLRTVAYRMLGSLTEADDAV